MTPYPDPQVRAVVDAADLSRITPPDLYGIDCLGLADFGDGAEWLALLAAPPSRRLIVVSRSDHCPTRQALQAAYPALAHLLIDFPYPSPGHHRIIIGVVELHLIIQQPWHSFDGYVDGWWGPQPEVIQPPRHFVRPLAHGAQRVAVIGAGLSGTQTADALRRRGVQVVLMDPAPASGASGNAQGMLYIAPQREPTPASLFWLQAFEHAVRSYRECPHFHPSGLFCMAEHADQIPKLQTLLAAIKRPPEQVRFMDADQASAQLGQRARLGGLFWPQSGWMEVAERVKSEAARLDCQALTALDIHEHDDGIVITTDGGDYQVDAVVLANATAVRQFAPDWLRVQAVRGQISRRRADQAVTSAVCGEGYLTPAAADGYMSFGASFNPKDDGTDLRAADDAANDQRVRELVELGEPGTPGASRASIRCASPDYLPMVGRLPDDDWIQGLAKLRTDAKWRPPHPMHGWRRIAVNVGHGSRGLTSTPLCADLVAADLTGEPLPIANGLFEHLTPARFLIRALKRNQL